MRKSAKEEKLETSVVKCFLCGEQCSTAEKNNWVQIDKKRVLFYHSDCYEKEYGRKV